MSSPPIEWPEHLKPGRVLSVAPGVRRIVAPNPGYMTGPGTNTYLIGEGPFAVVDPGPDDDAHLEALCEAVGSGLERIFVTHTHIDHSPLASRLRGATGAEVVAFGPAPSPSKGPTGVDPHDAEFSPDRLMTDRDRIDVGDFSLEAVHTPGHASNHLCFELAGTGLLFSGDHVMQGSTVVIAPPDGDMTLYLESLEKVIARRPSRIAPGHGDMIDQPDAVLDYYLRHRLEREAEVLTQLRRSDAGGTTPATLVERIYGDIPDVLHPVARYSVWAHLRRLAGDGRATSRDLEDIDAPWSAVAGRDVQS